MAYNKGNGEVQFKRLKALAITAADVIAIGSGAFLNMLDIPATAIVVGGGLAVTQVFNSTTSDTFVIKDAAGNIYKTAINGQVLGYTALTPTGIPGNLLTEMGLGVTWIPGSGTPTTGFAYLVIEYFVPGVGDEYFLLNDPGIAP
jgi:hypothetical protein